MRLLPSMAALAALPLAASSASLPGTGPVLASPAHRSLWGAAASRSRRAAGTSVRAAKRQRRTVTAAADTATATPPADASGTRYPVGEGEEMTLEEMRAALGPVGKAVAGAVEVGVVTAGSYLSGGAMGYVGGGLFGMGALFRPADSPPPPPPGGAGPLGLGGARPQPPPPPQAPPPPPRIRPGLGGEVRGRLGNLNSRAVASAGSWAQLSAAFSGFHALSRVVRGGREDRWNGIAGSAMTGAYLNRAGGPQAMLQGATTYASFTYMLDVFFGTSGGRGRNRVGPAYVDDQFDYQEEQLN